MLFLQKILVEDYHKKWKFAHVLLNQQSLKASEILQQKVIQNIQCILSIHILFTSLHQNIFLFEDIMQNFKKENDEVETLPTSKCRKSCNRLNLVPVFFL